VKGSTSSIRFSYCLTVCVQGWEGWHGVGYGRQRVPTKWRDPCHRLGRDAELKGSLSIQKPAASPSSSALRSFRKKVLRLYIRWTLQSVNMLTDALE